MHKEQVKEDEYVSQQKKRIDIFFTGNYKGIKKITYTDSTKNPTGTIVVSGYVNNDPDLSFEAFLTPYEDYEVEGTESPKFSNTFSSDKGKTVSEILKEQKEK
ncbi:DUF1433 domain-containing protein [Listeria grayi]|uniref:DUF1433 domain-containing protein n=1 Tax=Listeria grayi TaxID=1641 RepID=UPI00162AD71C|nr:DUF1433 domain-containing protein [Listeria grayi]MBC1923021.1 DUF1433 domain-containing protein [Listeria grayi]